MLILKIDELVKSQFYPFSVIPAKAGAPAIRLAGIQQFQYVLDAGSSPA
jgi:hypothetical protein